MQFILKFEARFVTFSTFSTVAWWEMHRWCCHLECHHSLSPGTDFTAVVILTPAFGAKINLRTHKGLWPYPLDPR